MVKVMKKFIQDMGVLGLISVACGFVGGMLSDWTGWDLKVSVGFFIAAIYFDWYKKGK